MVAANAVAPDLVREDQTIAARQWENSDFDANGIGARGIPDVN